MSELDFIYKRKSIRDFKDAPVPKEDILKMLEAATYAPSPKHQQNWHFVVVQDQEKIKQMADVVAKSHTAIANMMETEEEQKKYMKFLPYYVTFQRGTVAVVVYSKPYDMIEEKVLMANNVSEDVLEVLRSPQSAAQGIGAAVENFY
nr:nitroreductase family protein [Cellulosilyticum ruminicola]